MPFTHGLESGFVRKIVSKIKRKNAAASRFGQESLHRDSFAQNAARNDLRVPKIFDNTQSFLKRQQQGTELAPGSALCRRGYAEKVNRQAEMFVFHPETGNGGEMNRELCSSAPKRDECRAWKRRMTAALPSVKAKVADAGEADVAQEFGAATATDHDKCDARMTREAPQHPAGRGRQAHLIGAGRDINERAIKIEKHGDAAARLDLSGDASPIRGKAGSHALQSAPRASTRSGVSMRISVRSDRRLAAQR